MKSRVHHATMFALYQLTIAFGIVAMPIAIMARQAGFALPVHRLLSSVEAAYENTGKTAMD